MWEQYHNLVGRNQLTVTLFKVKAHASVDDVVNNVVSPQHFLGNTAADAFAKHGAKLWALPGAMKQQINFIRGKAWRIGLRMSAVITLTIQEYKAFHEKPIRVPRERDSLQQLISQLHSNDHDLDYDNSRVFCRRCALSFLHSRTQLRAALARGP